MSERMTRAEGLAFLKLTEGEPCGEPFGNFDDDRWLVDAEGVSHPGEVAYFGSLLGFCGCGDPVGPTRLAFSYLAAIAKRDVTDEWVSLVDDRYPEEVAYFVLYDLDNAKLTEHGGSVVGCWMTEKGRAVFALLEPLFTDDPNCPPPEVSDV